MLHHMATMTKEEKINIEENIYDGLFQLKEWKEAHTIGITYSQKMEWDTLHIMQEAWHLGKNVAIPKTDVDKKRMTFHIIQHKNDVLEGAYGIFEPSHQAKAVHASFIDLMFVPGVLFDCSGYRIGYGGGYYDRYLMDFNGKTISLLADFQLIDKIPVEAHDIPVQQYVTNTRIIPIHP